MSNSNTNQEAQVIIADALDSVRKGQMVFLEKIQNTIVPLEEAEKFAQSFLESLDENPADNMQSLLQASSTFVDFILGPHKRNMAALQYRHLKKLSTLTLDEFVEYNAKLEKLGHQFMVEMQPVLTKRFEKDLLPALLSIEEAKLDTEVSENTIEASPLGPPPAMPW